ncbi:hypothetical protein AURDEDRAFT_161761 [Auricularia subglabra TFB-10046 SS5]|nr:hypothetical protein AURDEDRAFT_161761 [Auricularia subglabra TFB-10046 SS5]
MDLTVVLRNAGDREHLGEALKAHMHRLRTLNQVIVRCADSAMTLASNAVFHSSAPSLESVSFVARGDEGATVHLGKHLFDGVPCASRLTLENNVGDLHTLFRVFPALMELDLSDFLRRAILPPIPRFPASVCISRTRGSGRELGGKGYLRIERCHPRVAVALHRAAECPLAVSADLTVELVTEAADGRTARLSTALDVVCDIEYALMHPAPALLLTVVCAEPVAATVSSLIVYALLLRRVEYVASADGRCYPGSPSSRNAFILRCFRRERPDLLEILSESEEVSEDAEMAISAVHAHAFKHLLSNLERELPGIATLPPLIEDDFALPLSLLVSAAPVSGTLFRNLVQVLKEVMVSSCAHAEQVAAAQLRPEDRAPFLATFTEGILLECMRGSAQYVLERYSNRPALLAADIPIHVLRSRACCLFLDSMRTRILGRTPEEARDWNITHDRMRIPTELWSDWLQYLSQRDRCTLSRVCSFWHKVQLIRRSGELPLSLSVVLRGAGELKILDRILKEHASRLRSLCIEVRNADYEMTLAARAAFQYSAPILTSVSFMARDGDGAAFRLSKRFLAGGTPSLTADAPNLRKVHFCGIPVPVHCSAFRHTTHLRLERTTGNLSGLFNAFPALTELDISYPHRQAVLPAIPARSSLRRVDIEDFEPPRWRMDPLQLAASGYLDLEHFSVEMSGAGLLSEVMNRAAQNGLTSSLTISGDMDVEHATERSDGRTLLFSTKLRQVHDIEVVLAQAGPRLRALTLPNCVTPEINGEFVLPRLESLTVICADNIGDQRPTFTIRAPLLRRVAFVTDTDPLGPSRYYPGPPARRDDFIRHALLVDDPSVLEVHVDPATPSPEDEFSKVFPPDYQPLSPAPGRMGLHAANHFRPFIPTRLL